MYTDRNMKRREEKLVRYMNEGNLPKLKSLLKKHRNIDVNIIKNSQGRTPLHTACLSSDDAIVRCLLKHGADATVQDFHGDTALHLSLSNALSGNKFAYFDIAVLLMRSFPECLKIKNKKGVSSKRLLKKVKEKLRNWEEEEKERARQNEKESEEREAEMRWNERLAEEWADDVGSSWYHHEWDTCNVLHSMKPMTSGLNESVGSTIASTTRGNTAVMTMTKLKLKDTGNNNRGRSNVSLKRNTRNTNREVPGEFKSNAHRRRKITSGNVRPSSAGMTQNCTNTEMCPGQGVETTSKK
ncbi:NF-kappa-B inhibitor-like protein 1 isoform X2 [Ptychodera flava]|uniref:NF-kappa-B inhibitor-like protein 1 isoform X2 n=1 Tax=Ptychodera flava TaxID=63121 RepID=UPI00396A02A2